MSYLLGSYLEDDAPEYDAGNATSALSPALGEAPDTAMITLPGGIVMPKKTFYAVIVIIAVIALLLFIRHRRAAAAASEAA